MHRLKDIAKKHHDGHTTPVDFLIALHDTTIDHGLSNALASALLAHHEPVVLSEDMEHGLSNFYDGLADYATGDSAISELRLSLDDQRGKESSLSEHEFILFAKMRPTDDHTDTWYLERIGEIEKFFMDHDIRTVIFPKSVPRQHHGKHHVTIESSAAAETKAE
jgi:hypothetical protein